VTFVTDVSRSFKAHKSGKGIVRDAEGKGAILLLAARGLCASGPGDRHFATA
jgi:hypothetical protein